MNCRVRMMLDTQGDVEDKMYISNNENEAFPICSYSSGWRVCSLSE